MDPRQFYTNVFQKYLLGIGALKLYKKVEILK